MVAWYTSHSKWSDDDEVKVVDENSVCIKSNTNICCIYKEQQYKYILEK